MLWSPRGAARHIVVGSCITLLSPFLVSSAEPTSVGGDEVAKINLAIIVNGRPTVVEANENAPLHSVIGKALEQSGNQGQPPENWEFKDAQGAVLPGDKKIEDFHFPPNVTLYLDLKRGVGG